MNESSRDDHQTHCLPIHVISRVTIGAFGDTAHHHHQHHHHPSRARVVADASVFETSRACRAYLVNVTARGTSSEDDPVLRFERRKEENARAHFGLIWI